MTLNDENLEMTKQATGQESSPEIRAVNAKIIILISINYTAATPAYITHQSSFIKVLSQKRKRKSPLLITYVAAPHVARPCHVYDRNGKRNNTP